MYVGAGDIQNRDVNPINISEDSFSKTAMESFTDAWDFQRFSGNSSSKQDNLHNEFETYIEEIQQKTGEKLDNPYRSGWGEFLVEDVVKGFSYELAHIPGTSYDDAPWSDKSRKTREEQNLKEFYQKVDKLRQKNPEMPYKSFEDIQNNILKKAEDWRQKQASGREENGLAAFAGTAAAAMTDPINATVTLLTAPITGGAAETVLKAIGKTAVIEGGINMATEAAIQPSVYQYHQELGDDYSVSDAAAAVGMAGAGGAVLSSALVGAGSLLKRSLARFNELKAKGYKFTPLEQEAADFIEDKIAFDDFMYQNSPYGKGELQDILNEYNLKMEADRLLQAQEMVQLAKAYDDVRLTPSGPADDPLIHIQPEDMKGVVIERGEYKPVTGGDSKSGYGLVKFIFKHGEESSEKIPVMKDDIVSFPRIMREYEPMRTNLYNNNRTWSVRRPDGAQVVYSARQFAEKNYETIVTIHTIDPEAKEKSVWEGIFSPKRQIKKEVAGNETAHTKDTAQKAYYHTNESSADASIPKSRFQDGGYNANNITSELKVVKKGDEIRYPTADEILRLLEKEDTLLPLSEVDGELKTVSARETLANIQKEDKWIDEITECIVEFSGK